VIPWETLGRARAPAGLELVLLRRGDEYVIRLRGNDLMSSRQHGSEERLAELACRGLGPSARVLIGGLGMGYTLRSALDVLPPAAVVHVAEVVPAVGDWNRGPLGPLAGRPLDDPRVTVEIADIGALLRRATVRHDAILLDVDNGPAALTRRGNQVLYSRPGLETARRALRWEGVLAVWSAARDDVFHERLARAGFEVEVVAAPARGPAGGTTHTIYLGRVSSPRAGPPRRAEPNRRAGRGRSRPTARR
jgi:spermidine synthase